MGQLSKPFHKMRWAGYYLLVGGITMVIGGIWFTAETVWFLDDTRRVGGTVVALERERGVKGFAEDHPVIRFVPPETGQIVEIKSRFGIWPSPFAISDKVEVAYDPKAPRNARVNSFCTLWLLPILMALFGLVCIAAGIDSRRRSSRNGTPPSVPMS